MRWPVCSIASLVATAALAAAMPARAQVDARALVRSLTHPMLAGGAAHCRDVVPSAFRAPFGERMSVLVELPAGQVSPGLRRVAPGLAAVEVTPAELAALDPSLRASWSPPLQLQLDRADGWTRASVFRTRASQSGQGAVVGVVDAGLDASHPDLRHADGTTRVAWYIDFSRDPAGRHPALEDEYGCTAGADFKCAVLSGDDIDEALASPGSLDEPRDTAGHGTHVASLAAGNGLASPGAQFVGIAPESTLIVARATRGAGGTILDADALLATRFIFDRAAEMGLPAAVNLSLGTDFGAHDGSSALERGLAGFVGPDQPGRAIVVAAGNSGTLHVGRTDRYPEPLGVHTEMHVPTGSSARVPLLTPLTGSPVTRATLLVWIAARPGDELSVGVDDVGGRWIEPVAPGGTETHQAGDIEVTVLNGTGSHAGSAVDPNSAVVVIDGAWASGATFAVRFEGHGTPRLWVHSEGDLSPAASMLGAVFPAARRQGTINVPATHPELIAVGATVNRTSWIDRRGERVVIDDLVFNEGAAPDSMPHFSAAGPSAAGVLKPDLVAPGAFVAGAMSELADPARNDTYTVFTDRSVCVYHVDCQVLDERHAITSGTSMAAPLVAGAAALLLAQDPSLTQAEVRALLQAGVRRPEGVVATAQQVGPGALDLDRTLDAARIRAGADAAATLPAPASSWIVLADDYAHPDPSWPLTGLLVLRDEDGAVAHGFDAARLRLEVEPGAVTAPLEQMAPGLYRFGVAAPAGSGGERLHLSVRFDDEVLVERQLSIAVDPWVRDGGVTARGGCTISARPRPPGGVWLTAGVAMLAALLRRRHAAR